MIVISLPLVLCRGAPLLYSRSLCSGTARGRGSDLAKLEWVWLCACDSGCIAASVDSQERSQHMQLCDVTTSILN